MKNIINLGASGNIAIHVIDILVKKNDINLTLFYKERGAGKRFSDLAEKHCHVYFKNY